MRPLMPVRLGPPCRRPILNATTSPLYARRYTTERLSAPQFEISLASHFISFHYGAMWSFDNGRQFASDNNAGICPEVLEALQNLSPGHVVGYGSDAITAKAKQGFRELFETDCDTYF